jgi:hypothetical protein
MEKRSSIRRVFMLGAAAVLLVLVLASPALASGAMGPATAGGPCAAMEITSYKARWSVDEKQSVSKSSKSETDKHPLASKVSKWPDSPAK